MVKFSFCEEWQSSAPGGTWVPPWKTHFNQILPILAKLWAQDRENCAEQVAPRNPGRRTGSNPGNHRRKWERDREGGERSRCHGSPKSCWQLPDMESEWEGLEMHPIIYKPVHHSSSQNIRPASSLRAEGSAGSAQNLWLTLGLLWGGTGGFWCIKNPHDFVTFSKKKPTFFF